MMQPVEQAEYVFPRTEDGDIIIETFEDASGRVRLIHDGDNPSLLLSLPGETEAGYWDAMNEGSLAGIASLIFTDTGYAYYQHLAPLIEQAVALDAAIRAVGDRGGYTYLEHRPHIKGFIRDVTEFYDAGWRAEYPDLKSIEETYFYDDSRRYHIASFAASIKGYAIGERVTWGADAEDPEDIDDELGGITEWVDYFTPPSPDWEAPPESDEMVRRLMLGDTTYEEFMDAWGEHLRGNEEF